MKPWEQNIRNVEPYVPGEQPSGKVIKLNTNENPYPPAPGVSEALANLNVADLRKYPDPTAGELVRAIAQVYGRKESEVFVGVGSDDVLGMAFMTFFHGGKPILFPDVTYSFYDVWAQLLEIPYEQIPLEVDFTLNVADYMRENGGIVIANPNAPTSLCLGLADIERLLQANRESVVIVDEAYIDFGGCSALPLIDRYENLVVVQTYSKSRSLAGMRIGYAFANEKLIAAMQAVKYSYNSYTMNMPSILAGKASVLDTEYFARTTAKIVATRERMKKSLAELGFFMPDSKTNFLFATHKSVPAKELFEKLREKQIYVRYFNKPRVDNYLRITIGTDEEMDRLFSALREILDIEAQ